MNFKGRVQVADLRQIYVQENMWWTREGGVKVVESGR